MADDAWGRSAAERTVLGGLDPEQRAAVTAAPGAVCILAGAGTGKTRSITHRIAYRAMIGEISPRHVLAVTFTARAAAQMRGRLARLGVPGVQARTFHSAALRQVRYFAPRLFAGRHLPELIDSKARLVTLAAARAGIRADRTTARDVASEIEWAKSSLVEPADYEIAAVKAARDIPLDARSVAETFSAYERIKRDSGVIDFEDLLRAAVWAVEEYPDIAEQVRAQYRHFVVDEYQDVNPIQQRLLEAWLGERDDVTVVGDASQTIYSFTGANSSYLVDFARRHPGATVVHLVRDYRSTPQIVSCANAVIAQARGDLARLRLELVGQRPDGPAPEFREFPDEPAEAASVAERCRALMTAGTPASEIAVLFRTNAQSEHYEEALAEAGVPYVVHGGERFFERPEVRRAIIALRAATRTVAPTTPLRPAVTAALEAVGWREAAPPAGGTAREQWEAVNALVGITGECPGLTLEAFCEELARRAAAQHVPEVKGVVLSSLHSAKGLEWDAVFVVGLAEGTLPTLYARTPETVEEERRLLYVGITRARQSLWLSYAVTRTPGGRQRRPCRFVPALGRPGAWDGHEGRRGGGKTGTGTTGNSKTGIGKTRADRGEAARRRTAVACRVCGATLASGVERKLGRCSGCPSEIDEELFERLRLWRSRIAAEARIPAYVIFTDATLTALAERRPSGPGELVQIGGIGPRKLALYGEDVLALIGGAEPSDLADQPET